MTTNPFFFFVTCVDPRVPFQRAQVDLMRELGMDKIEKGNTHHLQIPGGAGDFMDFAILRKALAIALEHHGANYLVLTVHEDCAAKKTVKDLLEAGRIVYEAATAHGNEFVLKLFVLKLNGRFEEIPFSN